MLAYQVFGDVEIKGDGVGFIEGEWNVVRSRRSFMLLETVLAELEPYRLGGIQEESICAPITRRGDNDNVRRGFAQRNDIFNVADTDTRQKSRRTQVRWRFGHCGQLYFSAERWRDGLPELLSIVC